MSKRSDQESLRDIQEAIRRIVEYVKGQTYERFLADRKTQDAVVRNLAVIGEATKNRSARVRKTYPDIPWKDLAGVRDKMIHHYFGISYEIVWKMCDEELPQLLDPLQSILGSESEPGDP